MKIAPKLLGCILTSLIFWIDGVFSDCSTGCLKCNTTSSQCLFCDFTVNYTLNSEGGCKSTIIENCLSLSVLGICNQCKAGYYAYGVSCLAVETPVEHCDFYLNGTSCKYCIEGYFLQNGACVAVSNTINNCRYYSSDSNTCDVCHSGTFLYIDKRYCIYIPQVPLCAAYTQVKCRRCGSGYILSENAYISSYFGDSASVLSMSNFISVYTQKLMKADINVCIPHSVKNCIQFYNNTVCLGCRTGFVLVDNVCKQVAWGQASRCLLWNAGACAYCGPFYRLEGTGCVAVSPVANCAAYDGGASYSKCIRCVSGYYLEDEVCKVRIHSAEIANCASLQTSSDECRSCSTGFTPTSDSQACLASLPNCTIYASSSRLSSAHRCSVCADSFAPSTDGRCQSGDVENCRVFASPGKCKTCMRGFAARTDGNCEAWPWPIDCPQPSFAASRSPTCLGCNSGQLLLNLGRVCVSAVAVDGCVEYSSSGVCVRCVAGRAVSGGQCNAPTDPLCLTWNTAGQCTACNPKKDAASGRYFVPKLVAGVCVELAPREVRNCAVAEEDGDQLFCRACSQGFFSQKLPSNFHLCVARSDSALSTFTGKLTNCERFSISRGTCVRCATNFAVGTDGTCQACGVTLGHTFARNFTTSRTSLSYSRKCFTGGTVTGCARYEMSVSTTDNSYSGSFSPLCAECGGDTWPVLDISGSSLYGMATIFENSGSAHHRNRFFFADYCISKDEVRANSVVPTADYTNCELWLVNEGVFGCFKCKFGYTGLVKASGNTNYIETCVPMSDCRTESKFDGLGGSSNQLVIGGLHRFPISSYVTCHTCKEATQIVFFGLSFYSRNAGTARPPPASLAAWDPQSTPHYLGETMNQTFCRTPAAELALPANCAVAMVVPELNFTSSGVSCKACAPGYRPVITPAGSMSSCTLIENCLRGEFNGCSQCLPGYAFSFSPKTGVLDTSYCFASPVANCLAGLFSVVGPFQCQLCGPGYYLDADFSCSPVEDAACLTPAVNFDLALSQVYFTLKLGLNLLMHFEPAGCLSCSPDYVALDTDSIENHLAVSPIRNHSLCFRAPKFDTSDFSSSTFIPRCAAARADDSGFVCEFCQDGSVAYGNGCYVSVTSTGSLCALQDPVTLECVKCREGNFLDSGVCYAGQIDGCLEYSNFRTCSRCSTGFVALPSASGLSVCLPASKLGCSVFAPYENALDCAVCADGFGRLSSNQTPASACFDIEKVANCTIYDVGISPETSTFECLACNWQYYMLYGFCARRKIIDKCLRYNETDNTCIECQPEYLLNSTINKCVSLAVASQAVPGCLTYLNTTHCSLCDEDRIQIAGACVMGDPSSLIPNCMYQDSAGCVLCKPGYMNFRSYCSPGIAQNCRTFETPETCRDCPSGFGFSMQGQIRNCEQMNLLNCPTPDLETPKPFKCLQCDTNFYLDANALCQPVTASVEFCSIYLNSETCLVCLHDMVLSPDGKNCFASEAIVSEKNVNCMDAVLIEEPVCVACGFGAFLSNGECIVTSNEPYYYGCMMSDIYPDSPCLICMSGYYMDDTGRCIYIPNTSNQPLSSTLFNIFPLIFAAILLIV